VSEAENVQGKMSVSRGRGQCPFRGVVVLSTEIHDRCSCSLFTLSSVAVRVCSRFISWMTAQSLLIHDVLFLPISTIESGVS